ncbi:MAG TPA: glycoside hydrolase family 76 protein [Anaerohalosphaeraceae bacterium]|nr:glycoside hydrolase family 76 protein [Anaerohalosphaeraceae bacterium]
MEGAVEYKPFWMGWGLCFLVGLTGPGVMSFACIEDLPAGSIFSQWGRETLETIERDHRLAGGGYSEDQSRTEPAYAWGHSILLLAYAQAAKADSVFCEKTENLIDFLQSYWVQENGIGGYDCLPEGRKKVERYYDDNAWIAMGLLDAYEACRKKDFLEQARKTIEFCLSGEAPQGGIWWRQEPASPGRGRNTCSTAPTAFACLRYCELTKDTGFLETAQRLLQWLEKTLQDEDGLFFDHIRQDGRIGRRKWSYNSAMPIRSWVRLYRLTGREEYLQKALRTALAARERWLDEKTGALHCEAMFAFTLIEAWVELAEVSGQEEWMQRARKGMEYVYQQVRDKEGRYSKRWDRPNPEPIQEWKLLYPSAAARGYWALAAAYKNKETNQSIRE